MVAAYRRALERQYRGSCSVIVEDKEMVDGVMEYGEKILQKGIPCHLSYKTIQAAGDPSPVSAVTQTVKLFLAPEVEVPAGSKIVVTQHGVTAEYGRSGPPAIYPTHQEIQLELFRGWA